MMEKENIQVEMRGSYSQATKSFAAKIKTNKYTPRLIERERSRNGDRITPRDTGRSGNRETITFQNSDAGKTSQVQELVI